MLGKGLLKGMGITFRRFLGKNVTVQYPEEKLAMSPRFRGGELALNNEKCIACSLCKMACPNAAIELTTVMNEDKKRQLSSYIYQSGRCLYCNLCVEACPTHALSWDKNYENSRYFRKQLDVDCLALSKPVEDTQGRSSDE